MKSGIIFYCMSFTLICTAASDSPTKSARRRSNKNIVAPSNSPTSSPKDRSKLMQDLSKQSKKTVNVREQNPYVLPLSPSMPRSKSNPENLAGSLMLLDEVSEALREAPVTPNRTRKGSLLSGPSSSISVDLTDLQASCSEGSLSPRQDVPMSPRSALSPRALVRVVSLKSMDAVAEREKRKQEYRATLSRVEGRIFDAVGLKNFEFIKNQPHLLLILGDLPKSDIESWYMAYLRSTVLTLQGKLETKRGIIKNLDSQIPSESPRDDSPDAVKKLIQAEQQDDLSPRKDSVINTSDGVRERIKAHLAAAKEESARLIGTPTQVEHIKNMSKAECSTSFPSMLHE